MFLTLILLSGLSFAGGLYLSRINDNFHDFFTEYVPFGEDAVLYLEEREFRRRYASKGSRSRPPRDSGDQIRIPSQNGVSWRVAEDPKKARYSRAQNGSEQLGSTKATQDLAAGTAKESVATVEKVKSEVKSQPQAVVSKKDTDVKPPVPEAEPKAAQPAILQAESVKHVSDPKFRAPEVNEPSRLPPKATTVSPIEVVDENDPVMREFIKIINDIITVVNAGQAGGEYSATFAKARSELSKIDNKLKSINEAADKTAEQKIKAAHDDFDRGAKALIQRIQDEMETQEVAYRNEYQKEKEKLRADYEEKLKSEIEQVRKVNEQRMQNELLEQSIELKQRFTKDVQDHVEKERDSRLGKLAALTDSVHELEKLTTNWNSIVDTNLQTQQLHIAVEAVRAQIDNNEVPRPFVRELAALKEIASNDPVVEAAIASINPSAYQLGIPSASYLIDRFRRVAAEVRKASLLPEDAGIASHASSLILSKLLFRKNSVANGDDVESILTRTEMYLEEGDLDCAAREMNTLQGWAKTLSRDWLGEARKVLEVQQALDVSSAHEYSCDDS